MNQDDAIVLLKANLTKTRLSKLMRKKPDFHLRLKLEAIDSILEGLPTEDTQPKETDYQIDTTRSVLEKAKGVIRKRHCMMNFESLYLDIKKETTQDDVFNQLIIANLEKQDSEPHFKRPLPVVKHKSEQQLIHGYQMLPKVVINTQIKRKRETINSLNQQFKSDKQLVKQQTLRELQQMKLPLIFEGVPPQDLKKNLEKFIIKGEFYQQQHKNGRTNKPPSLVQSFQSMNQYLIDSVDYIDKLNRIEKRQIRKQFEEMGAFSEQYHKLKVKTDPVC